MKIDGRVIADAILKKVRSDARSIGHPICLTAFTCEPNFETEMFLKRKRIVAESVGIGVRIIEFDREACQEEVVMSISHAATEADGIIVQLPFPKRIEMSDVLAVVPPELDVDTMTYDGEDELMLPPVVGSIKAILETHDISLSNKKVVVVGQGRLVGAPAAMWAKKQGALVTTIVKGETDLETKLKTADLIISGVGKPGLITKDMVREGVMVLDAGTSEESGVLKGDVDTEVEKVASLFTPVPGGIGPITVAVLLQNLVTLCKEKEKRMGTS